MIVFIPGSISSVRLGPGGTDPPDGSISPVTKNEIKRFLLFYLPHSTARWFNLPICTLYIVHE